ncbi:hypothetical protein H9L21_01270 [Aeromicrobium senzhongii]|uniref:Uncharacterized protein n=1 Tax=Aeromicrobium senzhongii TaxID=2663859 RepID=A0ABX6SZI9_9ACTN|nr:hypothetical protein [Aeromicrobium senzhongii]MTB88396.1 hypothetical protein [Aeromicrobium senzhongii]QNL94635.1 hypothetical protein H9L21_01270 [Aeromicrobium senzhongii]
MGIGNTGRRVNAAVGSMAGRVDGHTLEVANHAARVLTLAVRVLRWPTLVVLVLAWPFIAGLAVISVAADDTWLKVVAGVLAVLGGAISAAFGFRRNRILTAVQDEEEFATELGIAVALSDDVGEARLALGQLAGTGGGARVFSRLKGLWRGLGVGPGVLQGANDLPRARWFFPPKIGTTITLFFLALWVVPVSFVSCLLLAIALAAR